MSEAAEMSKKIHTVILDAGPLIQNVPPISTLLAQSHTLLTTPAVLSEIRDPDARNRIEMLCLPFLEQRTPRPESVKFVTNFAKQTGDMALLSKQDVGVLALAYEVECERNGGDWRLRRVPGQKGINGMPPAKAGETKVEEGENMMNQGGGDEEAAVEEVERNLADITLEDADEPDTHRAPLTTAGEVDKPDVLCTTESDPAGPPGVSQTDESDSDSDGWITPSNLKKWQARDEAISAAASTEHKTMQVATLTTDFAMQNVLLQMNLNLLSASTMQRIRHLRSSILRCHGCFFTTKEMNKQFCPRCGKPTLTRVSCSTSASGAFKLHLKKNMQWDNRGNRYSVPKPASGNASGKWKGGGGGQGGWGSNLILAEDQKEYVQAVVNETRRERKERDLMDKDYLPGILTGERMKGHGRIKVGAGRDVNSRKRR